MGQDPLTGTDYEHRRELIRSRLEFLAGIMGIEVLGYAIMSEYARVTFESTSASRQVVTAYQLHAQDFAQPPRRFLTTA